MISMYKKTIGVATAVIMIAGILIGGFAWARENASHFPAPANIADLEHQNSSQETIAVPPDHPFQIPILTYHTIAPDTGKIEQGLQKKYHITPDHFDAQMNYLADNGYTTVTFSAYANYLLGQGTIPEKSVVLTFDDGWKKQYDYAYPILKKYHFTGTFFVIAKSTSGSYMSWDDIRDLDVNGFEIASHTQTHANLPNLLESTDAGAAEKLRAEIFDSKKTIEEQLGHAITTIAYPYYQENEAVRKLVQEAGYMAARAGWKSFDQSAAEIFHLKSQEPVNTDNPFATK